MPAAIRQVAALMDRHLQLTAPRGRYFVDRLRAIGLLPNTPGVPELATAEHISLLLVAAMIGPSPQLPAADYLKLASATGEHLAQALARYLTRPELLLELRLDTGSPAAVVRAKDDNGSVQEIAFLSDEIGPQSKIQRVAVLDANAFSALAIAIRTSTIPTRERRHRRRRISHVR